MAWTLVTPASRGIGFALTRHLLQHTPPSVPVVATARKDLKGLRESLLADLPDADKQGKRLDVQKCDLLSESSIEELSGYCKERYNDRSKDKATHLRLGFFIPGMLVPEKAPEKIEYEAALETLKLNVLADLMLAKWFSGFLPKKSIKVEDMGELEGLPKQAVMAFMSARVGSISDNKAGGWYSYRASKAGLNQMVKSLDIYLKMQCRDNAVAVGLHPGTVRTELSRDFWGGVKEGKLFSPEYSAERLVDVVVNGMGGLEGRGKCWDWEGKEIPP